MIDNKIDAKIKIQCINTKKFKLIKNNKDLGLLKYDCPFLLNARIMVENIDFRIIPKGIFNTEITVKRGDFEIAFMKMNWKGSIIISFKNREDYILKPTGTFLSKFAIENKNGKRIMMLDPIIDWSKLNYNYAVSYEGEEDILLILLAVYTANYYIAVMSGVL